MSTNQCKLLLNMADVLVDSCVAKWVSAEHWATNKQTIVFQINLVFLQISWGYVTHLYQFRAWPTWRVYSFHSHHHKWSSYYLPTDPRQGRGHKKKLLSFRILSNWGKGAGGSTQIFETMFTLSHVA